MAGTKRVAETLAKFRNAGIAKELVRKINGMLAKEFLGRTIRIMHVCGSHEHTVTYYGLRTLLSRDIELISGPGCPVCVCGTSDIREAIEIAKRKDVIMCTFGDMVRDRTPYGSLDDARRGGADVRIVYSPLDAKRIAIDNPEKEVVFFGVGFETTSAPISTLIYDGSPDNLSILTSLKKTSPAVEALLRAGEIVLDGVIAPGHVSAIVGANDWENLPSKFKIPTVVSGFEPVDILISIESLLKQMKEGRTDIEIEYKRLVTPEGNTKAQEILSEVFDVGEAHWRGVGKVPGSGYFIKKKFGKHDARKRFGVSFEVEPDKDMPAGCKCHLVVTGKAYPSDCPLFNSKACRPDSPYGPCMVSGEGTCYIWYRYGNTKDLKDKMSAKGVK